MTTSASRPLGRFADAFEVGFEIGRDEWNDGRDVAFDEIETALHAVEHEDADVHQLEEFEAGKADGSRADDEDGFTGLRFAALHRMAADGERFDERELVVAEVVADMEFARGDDPCGLPQTAIGVHAEHLHAGAAV